MSRFYSSIQGNRGEATRCGHTDIAGHIRGWYVGVRVYGYDEDGADVFDVYATSGSNGGASDRYLGTVSRSPDGFVAFYPAREVAS